MKLVYTYQALVFTECVNVQCQNCENQIKTNVTLYSRYHI